MATVSRPTAWTRRSLTIGRTEPVHPALRVAEGQSVHVSLWESLSLLSLIALLGSLLGVRAATMLHIYPATIPSPLDRTFSVVQVFHGIEPRLANLGFVHPPIPALLEFPLVAWFPQLAYLGVSALLVSSVCAGASLMIFNLIMARHVPRRPLRYGLLALYQLNPLVLYLTISGAGEMVFLMFMLLAWLAFQRVYFEEPLPFVQVGVMGIALGLGFLSLFEGFIFGIVLFGVFAVVIFLQKRPGQWDAAEGLTVAALTPFGYAVITWLFFNKMIMNNPLFFVSGPRSLQDKVTEWVGTQRLLQDLLGNPALSTEYVFRATWGVAPALILLLPLGLALMLLRRDLFLMSVFLVVLSFPLSQGVLLLQGQSFGWLRDYVPLVPFTILMAAYCTRPRYFPLPSWVPMSLPVLAGAFLLLWGNAQTWGGLQDPAVIAGGEVPFLKTTVGISQELTVSNDWVVSAYFREDLFNREPEALVFVDDSAARNLILLSGHPRNFITPNIALFYDFLLERGTSYVLVPDPEQQPRDAIAAQYPHLFERGAPFALLTRSFQDGNGVDWKLYQVTAQ